MGQNWGHFVGLTRVILGFSLFFPHAFIIYVLFVFGSLEFICCLVCLAILVI
nr:MAG TPA: hypothetical protein [Caudoviricetes sp.]